LPPQRGRAPSPPDVLGRRDHIVEPDGRRHGRKLFTVEILSQPAPSLDPQRFRRHDRVDAEQRDAAQDEGHD
jgi:hypothetical protein